MKPINLSESSDSSSLHDWAHIILFSAQSQLGAFRKRADHRLSPGYVTPPPQPHHQADSAVLPGPGPKGPSSFTTLRTICSVREDSLPRKRECCSLVQDMRLDVFLSEKCKISLHASSLGYTDQQPLGVSHLKNTPPSFLLPRRSNDEAMFV